MFVIWVPSHSRHEKMCFENTVISLFAQ